MSRGVVLLREWASVVEQVERGAVVLVRKGGISEGSDGFAVEAGRFVLWPTVFHQHRGAVAPPAVTTLRVGCELVSSVEVPSSAELSGLSGLHGYTAEQLRVRAAYRPQRPLTLLVVRPFRLEPAVELATSALPASCRSWAVWETARVNPAWVAIDVGDAVERATAAVQRLGREAASAEAARREAAYVAG
ncbi:MAG: DUF1802 family protein [Tepidisphaerales bacterium]